MVKRRNKSKILTARSGETPTPERYRQNGGVTKEIAASDNNGHALLHRFRATADCPLDAYFQRGKLSEPLYRAGTRFRHAYFRVVLRVVHVEGTGCGTHGDPEAEFLTPVYSERLLREAYGILSPKQKTIIIAVCGHDEWAGGAVNLKTLLRGLEQMSRLWKMG